MREREEREREEKRRKEKEGTDGNEAREGEEREGKERRTKDEKVGVDHAEVRKGNPALLPPRQGCDLLEGHVPDNSIPPERLLVHLPILACA